MSLFLLLSLFFFLLLLPLPLFLQSFALFFFFLLTLLILFLLTTLILGPEEDREGGREGGKTEERTRFTQSQNSTISVACTRLSFKFPSSIKVRNVRKEPLQLHLLCQCWACILKPPAPGTSGKFANSEKLPPPWSGYGRRETQDL